MAKANVPTATDTSKKWADVTPGRATYYEKNASVAGAVWEKGASDAAATYKQAVSSADIGKKFSGGIKGKSGKYDRKVKDVGVSRFGPGIAAALVDYEAAIGPVLSTIAGVDLPERKPRGDPTNYMRVSKIGDALNKARLAKLAVG